MGTHCDKLVDTGQRKFLTGASVAAVSAAASTVVTGPSFRLPVRETCIRFMADAPQITGKG